MILSKARFTGAFDKDFLYFRQFDRNLQIVFRNVQVQLQYILHISSRSIFNRQV